MALGLATFGLAMAAPASLAGTAPALLLATPARATAPARETDEPAVEYAIRLAPDQDELPVRAAFPTQGAARLTVELPRWRPGSYRFQPYRDRIEIDGAFAPDGAELRWSRLHEGAWEVETAGNASIELRYRLAVNQDERGGMLEGPGTWLYASRGKSWPCRVRFEIEAPWSVASGLDPTSDPSVFEAPDYDTFADCPVLFGELERHVFETHGAPHHVVFRGNVPKELDRQQVLDGVQRIVRTQLDLMQDRPYRHYWFLYTLGGGAGGGGLEHLNSTNIALSGTQLVQNPRAGDDVTAHEFFHLWNVKRVRPAVLGPFDYQRDNRTRALWFCEGVTSYYATLTLVRSGLREPRHLWRTFADEISKQESSSGALEVSAEDASWEVWDAAGPDEPRINYYVKGQLLGFLLDLRIRHETDNTRSLDDVLRFLNSFYAREGVGYAETDLRRAVDAVTGLDSSDFFDRYVAGTVPPPYAEYARYAGIDVELTVKEVRRPPFAIDLAEQPAVRELDRRSQAYADGLRSGDLLLAVADQPMKGTQELRDAFEKSGAVERVAVKVRRGQRELDLSVRPRLQRSVRATATPLPEVGEREQALREGLERGLPAAPRRTWPLGR
ncbi:MAG: M61 family metallopeptidase [Planctomycetes bacterium]|nr:M61 family metallopeptidase [Planctomycetota bacterium]